MSEAHGKRLLMIEQGGRGGVADYTTSLVREIARLGWAIELATAADHVYPATEGVTMRPTFHYLRDDSPLGRALRRRGLGRIVNGLLFLAALPALTRMARRADVVHSQGWEAPQIGLLAMICMKLAGARIVQTSHGTFERGERFLRTRRLVRELTARLATRTIVHTQADLARVPAAAVGRTAVIPHGEYGGLARRGRSAERGPSRDDLGISQRVPLTLLFGQLRTDKGLGDLIESMHELPELHLLIGGEDIGGLAAQREALAHPALAGRVTIREGFLDMDEAAQLFAAADTVALPYQAASQSGVLLLAYGFARPVVVYPVGGLVEAVLDGETGWVCSSATPAALTEALRASIEAGAQECARRGQAGSRYADERFSWDAIASSTVAVYEEALSAA